MISDGNGNHSIHVASRHGNADILSRLLNSSFAQIQQFDTKNYKGMPCFILLKTKKFGGKILENVETFQVQDFVGETLARHAVALHRTRQL